MQGRGQKFKMLKLVELLQVKASPEAPLTTAAICEALAGMGIACDKRTLSQDIQQLQAQGYAVQQRYIGHAKAYYLPTQQLHEAEVRLLMDAVQAASFLPDQQTEQLMAKLAQLGAVQPGNIPQKPIHFNRCKHTNEAVYATVETLSRAILQGRQVSFLYFDRDENGNKVYRREKAAYLLEPISLVYREDKYYLLSYNAKYSAHNIYRLDRMERVAITKDPVSPQAHMEEAEIAEFVEQTFGMYNGPAEDVALQFDQSLIGAIQDHFGEDTRMIRLNAETCIATLKVRISPAFWGWLFRYTGKMRIISPDRLVAEYRQMAELAAK